MTSFYLKNTKEEGEFYLLTGRHVVSDIDFDKTDVPVPVPVVLCNHLFEECMEQIEYLTRKNQRRAKHVLDYSPLDIKELGELRKELVDQWSQESQRRIGIAHHHPPTNHQNKVEVDVDVDVDDGRGLNDWGNDWALIKLDKDDLPCSTKKPLLNIDKAVMLRFSSIRTEDDMEKSSLAVIMRGAKNGIRLGQSMSVFSMVRYPYSSKKWIQQWAITTMNEWEFTFRKSSSFADQGDSGAGVVSRDGKFGGIVVGATGRGTGDESRAIIDIVYVMLMFHITERMTESGLGDFPAVIGFYVN
ncbi:hypothetical protein I204_00847 [Kwoniella mangroviensis CBS 8886]|nr:hypothetical protein I204_00847 [Kwoniella mangroviensis CBS 8886]